MDFFSGVWSWFTGSSLSSALTKTALLGYVSRLLGNSTGSTSTGSNEIVDKGVRLQLNPDTENKIPVLYGEAYFGGYITDAQLSSDYKKMTYCLTLAELTGNKLSTSGPTSYTFDGVYINNNRVVFKSDGVTVDYTLDSSGNQDVSARDLIKIYFYCNQTGVQPQGYGGITPSPFSTMPGWSALTHSMSGLCYAIVEITYNKDKGISSLPTFTFHVTSDCVLPGDVLYDYMTNTRYGAGISSADITTSSLTSLNTFCTTGFSYTNLSGSTASSAISINGLVDTKTDVLTNIQAMAEAGSSWMTYDIHTGTWKVVINKAGTSIASFTDSNIVGEIAVSGTSLTQLNNVADVKYQNTDILDNTDFVKISIPSGSLFANEPLTSVQINLPFTNKQVVAAKIGLQQLKQGRVDKIIKFKTDYSYIMLGAGDIIDITSSVYGFSNKLFRIITVTQTEGDAGEILLDFTALEYDSNVYTYNITEYLVESDSGILGIGSIGKPNVPNVTKTEQANVPKIVINAVVPSGIVDAMEYWITFDTAISNDNARTYVKIGQYSNTNGSVLTEDTTVSYTYSGLQQSDFYIKVRGVNNVTTGPFSNPTGLIAYVPVVVADTISDTPVSIGGQLMGLGLLTLLNNLDKLFAGDTALGGVASKVFDWFKEATGYDLVGQASGGSLVVPAQLEVQDEGTTVTTTTGSLNFVGDGVVATADGSDVTVTFTGSGSGGTPTPTSLTVSEYYPNDRITYEQPPPQRVPDKAPTTGSLYVRYSNITYGTLTKGSGVAALYKSNGTLVQTIAASSITIDGDIISIPFNTREAGVDYYVLMDKGYVTANGLPNKAITNPQTWNFHTWADQPELTVKPTAKDPGGPVCYPLEFRRLRTYSRVQDPDHKKVFVQSNIGLEYNINLILTTSGTIEIKSSYGTHQTFSLSQTFAANKISELFWVSGNTLWLNVTKDFTPGRTYWVTITANAVKNSCGSGNAAITNNTTAVFTVDPGPDTKETVTNNNVTTTSGLSFKYDRPVVKGNVPLSISESGTGEIKSIQPSEGEVSIKEG